MGLSAWHFSLEANFAVVVVVVVDVNDLCTGKKKKRPKERTKAKCRRRKVGCRQSSPQFPKIIFLPLKSSFKIADKNLGGEKLR